MTSRPFDVDLSLRQHGASLRQLAAELLGDGAAADDAVQETWLRAIQWPPRDETAHGGWLATVLRNVARRLRRGERRRLLREAVVARTDEVEDHAAALAREELLHRLVAEVSALDAPFRQAIWQRYFEGMAPREIARMSGVPVATVKSRLQRGLQQLREKLGEEGESDWRGALAVAFGLKEGAVPVGAATATAWSGVLLMTAWTKTLAAVAVLAVAGLLLWSLREPAVAAPVAKIATREDSSAVAAASPKLEAAEVAAAPSATERVAATPVGSPTNPKNATLRGRCVDANGTPLAGCRVVLRGLSDDQRELETWRRDHPAVPQFHPVSLTTAADGAFAFEFEPPAPFRFVLDVGRDDRVSMHGGWPKIEVGAKIELGNIVLAAAVRVAGRVLDEDGLPVAKANVAIDRTNVQGRQVTGPGQMEVNTPAQGKTDEGGYFVCSVGVAPGPGTVRVYPREVVQPQAVEFSLERPQETLAIVVRTVTRQSSISGRVVDEAGRPVAGAVVTSEDAEGPNLAFSDAEGAFTVHRKVASTAPSAQLSVRHDGQESTRSNSPVAWGTRDVEFRLIRARGLSLRIVDAKDAPILDYRIHLLPQGGIGWPQGDDLKERAHGPFENGTATIPGVKSGKWLVIVDFPAETSFLKKRETIELVEGGPNLFTLRAEDGARRSLRVVDAAGEPVRGTRVQLCDLGGRAFGAQTRFYGERMWLMNQWNPSVVLVQFEGTTDADGRVTLVGEGRRDLGLRILGPGHVLIERPGIRLDVESELLVRVQRGARLVGKVTPPEVMDDLRRRARLGPKDAFAAERQPRLRLRGGGTSMVPSAGMLTEGGGSTQFDLGGDGAFDLTGLPAGSWRVELVFWDMHDKGASSNQFVLGEVVLADDGTTRLDADLQSMLPGTLEGEVTVNGVPFANGTVTLQATHGTRDGQPDTTWSNLETDAQGRFTHHGRAGDYSAIVTRPPLGPGATKLRALGSVTVVRGETTRQTFAVLSGTLRCRVLDPNGAAAAGVEVRIVDEAVPLPRTAADGTTTAEVTAQNISLRVLPKRLQSQEAQNKAWNETRTTGQTDPFASCWITLGTATIAAGQTTTLELRLPPKWEK